MFFLSIEKGYNDIAVNGLKELSTSALFYHRLIEAFKFAYAKRSELGDPSKINITDVNSILTFQFSMIANE